MRTIIEGLSFADIPSDHGFNRPKNLSGIITDVEFFSAASGSGNYCRITVTKNDQFLVRAQEAIYAGLPENAKPNEYFLESGISLRIRKL